MYVLGAVLHAHARALLCPSHQVADEVVCNGLLLYNVRFYGNPWIGCTRTVTYTIHPTTYLPIPDTPCLLSNKHHFKSYAICSTPRDSIPAAPVIPSPSVSAFRIVPAGPFKPVDPHMLPPPSLELGQPRDRPALTSRSSNPLQSPTSRSPRKRLRSLVCAPLFRKRFHLLQHLLRLPPWRGRTRGSPGLLHS